MQLEDIGPRLRDVENRLELLEKRNGANTSLDTVRLDWLEANRAEISGHMGEWQVSISGRWEDFPARDTIREAIDAAMRKED